MFTETNEFHHAICSDYLPLDALDKHKTVTENLIQGEFH